MQRATQCGRFARHIPALGEDFPAISQIDAGLLQLLLDAVAEHALDADERVVEACEPPPRILEASLDVVSRRRILLIPTKTLSIAYVFPG